MFKPGDVVHFYSTVAGKRKYHLCLSLRGRFLFVNSPKAKVYKGDFVVPCSSMSFLTATESGKSVISCSTVVKMTDSELRHIKAERLGSIENKYLFDLVKFVEVSPVLTPEEKDAILDELGDSI